MKVPAAKKLPSGQWRCQIQIDGQRYSLTGKTKREAEKLAAGIKSGYRERKEKRDSITLNKAISAYIQAKGNVLSPSTIRGYKTIQSNYFKPLMKVNIYNLNLQTIQIAVNNECRNHSAKTVRNAFGLVHTVLTFYNVDIGAVKLPQLCKTERKWLQSNEVEALLKAIDGDKCELPILLAIWLGMRRSEILGLCWDCVDLDQGILIVRRTYVYAGAGKWELKETAKTVSSQRIIHLPEYIIVRFQQLPRKAGRIFDGFDPGLPRKRLQRACEKAGITVTHLHGLRHTFAAIMLRQGVNERIVMRQGGWTSNRTMREIYDYIMDEDSQKAQELRDAFFNPSKNAHENAHD